MAARACKIKSVSHICPHRYYNAIYSMYAMFYKFATASLRQKVMELQNALTLQQIMTNPCFPEATEAVDENIRLHQEVLSLQDALKAANLLRVGIPEGALPLVDQIQRKFDILQVSQMWMDGWGQA